MKTENYLLAHYKGFFARIWFDDDNKEWIGRILDVDDLMVFNGETLEEALGTFHGGVEVCIEAAGGKIGRRPKTQVMNMIQWGVEMPDFEAAAKEFINEDKTC